MSRCTRCQGQMTLERDMHGIFWNCFQCGHNIDTVIYNYDGKGMVSITGRQDLPMSISVGSPRKYISSFTMGDNPENKGVDINKDS